MLKQDIIGESTSAYASPVVLVKKPNNEYRFAIDYRTLNAVTPIQTFPTVRLEDVFDAIGQNKAIFFQPYIWRRVTGKLHWTKKQNINQLLSHMIIYINSNVCLSG